MAVELRETRLENKRVWYKKENKGAAYFFGANPAHLINLVKVTDTKGPPPQSGRPSRGKQSIINSYCCRGNLTLTWRTWGCAPQPSRHPPC